MNAPGICLSFVRGGAISTPTRRYSGRDQQHGPLCCTHCDCLMPSARHYFESCPGKAGSLSALRDRILTRHGITLDWWTSQPMVTSKSAWITLGADPSYQRRAILQIAVAEFVVDMTKLISAEDCFFESAAESAEED